MNDEQKQFIIDRWGTQSIKSIRIEFNKKYGTNYLKDAFRSLTKRLGLEVTPAGMTDKQKQFIIENWDKMSVRDLRKLFNKVFCTDYKETAFHYHTNRMGLKKFNSMHKYTKEQDEFLKNNSSKMSREELVNTFNKRFNLSINGNVIKVRCCNKNWLSDTYLDYFCNVLTNILY